MSEFRAHADRLSDALQQPGWRPSRSHIEQARNRLRQAGDEIDGLRAALQKIANMGPATAEITLAHEMADTAMAALNT